MGRGFRRFSRSQALPTVSATVAIGDFAFQRSPNSAACFPSEPSRGLPSSRIERLLQCFRPRMDRVDLLSFGRL
jgi:hypothetical protein